MIIDYISSGNSSMKIFSGFFSNREAPEIIGAANCIKSLSTESKKYSFLFNAYTEDVMGKEVYENFRDCFHSIHSDSGGLQMITRGVGSITKEMKMKIYETQAKYSDVAMSFDEIPITTTTSTVSITDMSGRYFDHSKTEIKARETAQNLKEQIDFFRECKTTARPMIIMQGNCMDSFQTWIDVICDYLGPDLEYIHGISMAGTSLGGGPLEDVVRSAATVFLRYPENLNTKNIHMLGVGSTRRLLPFASLKSKLDGVNLSYDSTTHSHAIFKGTYAEPTKVFKWFSINPNKRAELINKLNDMFGEYLSRPLTRQEADEVFNGSLKYQEAYGVLGGHSPRFTEIYVALTMFMIKQTQDATYELVHGRGDIYCEIAETKGGLGAYQALSKCNTRDDYDYWERTFKRFLKSDRVKSSKDLSVSLYD